MKPILLLLLASFLLSDFAFADQGLGVRLRRFDSILPKGGTLECRLANSSQFGYVMRRGQGDEVLIDVITNNVNEGEKSRFKAMFMSGDNFNGIYLKHHDRNGEYGKYLEFLVLTQPDPHSFAYNGAVMMTEAFYSKDAEGKEQEDLYPLAKMAIRCNVLR